MLTLKVAVSAGLTAVLVAGPAFAGQHYRVVAKEPANHARIEVPVGDQLQLRLTACETCGYRWKIVKKPDPAVIAFQRRQSSVNGACPSPCTGGNATERWLFQSKSVGHTVVKLGYFGPTSSTPTKIRRLRLAVVR